MSPRPPRPLAAALVVLLAAPAAAQDRYPVEVTASALNVRDTPGGTVLDQVSQGTVLVAHGERSGWLAVDLRGREAWLSATYVRRTQAAAVVVEASALNVRSGPSTANAVLGTAAADQAYAQLATSSGWVQVQFDHRAAWVSGAYVRPLAAPAPAPAPSPTPHSWAALHRGLDLDGGHVPRAGLANTTLRRALGVSVEPYGEQVTIAGRAFVRGRVSWFGGPRDTGVTASETGAITGQRLRALNSPLSPDAATLAAHADRYYYCAMRFDYTTRDTSWWRRARLLVLNPATGQAVVVRPVDWGPNTRTGRLIDLSPQALHDLGLDTDGTAVVSFAAPDAPLGRVR
jgi:uncharacterized protein YraI